MDSILQYYSCGQSLRTKNESKKRKNGATKAECSQDQNTNPVAGALLSLRIGTLFSGIGAFEQSLKLLKIKHSIEFACDNGEIELIPLEKNKRCRYRDLEHREKRSV